MTFTERRATRLVGSLKERFEFETADFDADGTITNRRSGINNQKFSAWYVILDLFGDGGSGKWRHLHERRVRARYGNVHSVATKCCEMRFDCLAHAVLNLVTGCTCSDTPFQIW